MYEKVKELIKSHKSSDIWDDIASEFCGSYHSEEQLVSCDSDPDEFKDLIKFLKDKGITIKGEDGYGGEGYGDDYWGVFSITWNGQIEYVKLSGWYASYNGSEVNYWDWTLVEKRPVQTYEWKEVR